uniref:YGL025 protein n=1 Tax=Saccharomyces cerevisiae TaxID=4932 RepID=E9P9X7_YEASX|nr:Unknown [Saccharomyces cerevisiae]
MFTILIPIFSVLSLTFCLVSEGSVNQDNKEEYWEKPWEHRVEPARQGPNERLSPIGSVVNFSSQSVPTINQ